MPLCIPSVCNPLLHIHQHLNLKIKNLSRPENLYLGVATIHLVNSIELTCTSSPEELKSNTWGQTYNTSLAAPFSRKCTSHLNKKKKTHKKKKQNLVNILTSSCWKLLLFEKSRTFLFALIASLLGEWMLPVFSQAAWRWRASFFLFTKNNKTSQGRRKQKKERELLRARLCIHLRTLVSMGISLVLCGGWTAPCSLMPPTLHLCGQLSFGLLSSPSSSSLLSNKTGVTKMKKSFNKLAELGLHQSPLKPFYCHQWKLDEALTA